MRHKVDTIIIGGGQAGLSTSYYLNQIKSEHIVLEKNNIPGSAWQYGRWDSFALLTPNWSFRLPGAEYQRDVPDAFMPKADIVSSFANYVERFHLPVVYNTIVNSVEPAEDRNGFVVRTEDTSYETRNIVIATGLFQYPKLPAFCAQLDHRLVHLHSSEYRNPQTLPPGAVLVVGSGQSGCQIAEELYQSGRKVYLCVSGAGRAPRRYRGKDIYEWMHLSGALDRTVDKLPSPREKFLANPHLSGRAGGHSLNLHQFARDGVSLLGKILGGRENRMLLAPDLHENLARADQFETELMKMLDGFITRNGLIVPQETISVLKDGYSVEPVSELDLSAAGVASFIWATGYRFDFSMVKFPVFDQDGYPWQSRGVTQVPGLYFVGLPWLYKQKSGLLVGVGEDAEYIARQIQSRF